MVWPTVGSSMAKEQNRTELVGVLFDDVVAVACKRSLEPGRCTEHDAELFCHQCHHRLFGPHVLKTASSTPTTAAALSMFVSGNIHSSLWSPYVIGKTIIFSSCFFFLLLLSFPRLISVVGDWMSAILPHMVWP